MRHLLFHELLNQCCKLLLVLKAKLVRVYHGVQLLFRTFEAPKHKALDFLPLSRLVAKEQLIWLGELAAAIDVCRDEGVEVPVALDEEYLSLAHSDAMPLFIIPWIQVRYRRSVIGRHIPTEAVVKIVDVVQVVQCRCQTQQPRLWVVLIQIN